MTYLFDGGEWPPGRQQADHNNSGSTSMVHWLAFLSGLQQPEEPSSNRLSQAAGEGRTSEDDSGAAEDAQRVIHTLAQIESAIESIAGDEPLILPASRWHAVGVVHDEAILALVAETGWRSDAASTHSASGACR